VRHGQAKEAHRRNARFGESVDTILEMGKQMGRSVTLSRGRAITFRMRK
jgi:hypothetical protein